MTDDPTDPTNDDQDAGYGVVPRYLRGQLTAYEIAVVVALSWRVDRRGECYLRHKRLAEEAGQSVSTTKRALDTLREKGIVDWTPKLAEDGSVLCNTYRLDLTPRSVRPTPQVGESETPGHTDLQNEPPRTNPHQLETSGEPDAPIREDVESLCVRLASLIEENGSKRPTITKAWRDAGRLMLDKDGRTFDQVVRAIDWSQRHEFWRSNILSMPKLREKYDQLRLQAERERVAGPAGRQADTDALFAASAARMGIAQ